MQVLLGDDSTRLQIKGYGMLNVHLNGARIRQIGYYVPELGTTLLSIKHHMKFKGNYFHAKNNTVTLAYPTTILYPKCSNEFILKITPAVTSTKEYTFNKDEAKHSSKNDVEEYQVLNSAKAASIPSKIQQIKLLQIVKVKKLLSHVSLPTRATPGSIGFDVAAAHSITVKWTETKTIGTGLAMAVPDGLYLRLATRSSHAIKNINVGGSVIDNDYRGEAQVIIQNNSNDNFNIQEGDKIAQMIFEQAQTPCLVLQQNLDKTSCNNGSFGSTNKKFQQESKKKAMQNKNDKLMSGHKPTQKQTQINDFFRSSQSTQPFQEDNTIPINDNDDQESVKTEKTSNTSTNASTPNQDCHASEIKPPPAKQPQCEKDVSNKIPVILPNEKCNKSIAKHLTFSKDFISQAVGHHKFKLLMKYFNQVSAPILMVSAIDKSEILNDGETATLKSKHRNTNKFFVLVHAQIPMASCSTIPKQNES